MMKDILFISPCGVVAQVEMASSGWADWGVNEDGKPDALGGRFVSLRPTQVGPAMVLKMADGARIISQ